MTLTRRSSFRSGEEEVVAANQADLDLLPGEPSGKQSLQVDSGINATKTAPEDEDLFFVRFHACSG
jgi:hypothetical protein